MLSIPCLQWRVPVVDAQGKAPFPFGKKVRHLSAGIFLDAVQKYADPSVIDAYRHVRPGIAWDALACSGICPGFTSAPEHRVTVPAFRQEADPAIGAGTEIGRASCRER